MAFVIATQFKFKCPVCGLSITLPRQSNLGAYVNEKYDAFSGSWPIQWLCIPGEQVCECSSDRIERIGFEEQPRVEFPASVWKIEHPCSKDVCDAGFRGYAWWDSAETCRGSLADRIVTAKPKAPCSVGHSIDWQAEKIEVTVLPF
jgi:hypothetical protein